MNFMQLESAEIFVDLNVEGAAKLSVFVDPNSQSLNPFECKGMGHFFRHSKTKD